MRPSHPEACLEPARPSPRNAFIDLLRALAIVEVLLHHLVDHTGAREWTRVFRAPMGVQVFLVLSGWLLGGQLFRALARQGRLDIPRFLGRRWLRTLPAYYALLALRAVAGRDTLAELAGMFFFLQNYLAPGAWMLSWSLCVQEYFYLALPFVLLLTARRRWLGIALGVAFLVLSPVLRWYAFRPSLSVDDYFAIIEAPTHMRLDGVVVGVLLAALSEEAGPVWAWCRRNATALAVGGGAVIAVVAFGPWHFDPASKEAVSALACATGILGLSVGAAMLIPATTTASASPRWWHEPAAWVADHAYVLYLLHAEVFSLALAAGRRLHLPLPLSAIAAVTATFCVGWALRTVVEKPALRARRWLLDRPPQAAAPAAPAVLPPAGPLPLTVSVEVRAPEALGAAARLEGEGR